MSMLDTSHFDLNNLPNGFYEDPFKYYSSLRQTDPVKFLPDNSVLISSWEDLNSIYRDTQNFKSDKKISFGDAGLKTKSGNKKRAKSFAARHNCEKKNDKQKAGYWACRLPRYGLVKGGKWW